MTNLIVKVLNPNLTITQQQSTLHVSPVVKSSIRFVYAGSPGRDGIVDTAGALMVTNRLSEFDSPQSKVGARTNLELEHIDCGVFL